MKVLVTGSAGFIGYHVTRALLDQGHTVWGLDNFNPYYSVELKRARHRQLLGRERFTEVIMDLSDAADIFGLCKETGFDAVCNLAAQAGVRYSLEQPQVYIDANIGGFLHVLEACRHCGISRLVYASSSSVYGGNTKLPFAETDRVDTPVSLYAASKKANELMAHSYSHLFDIQTVGLRFFTVYGPWGRPDMAMWLFTEAIMAGHPISVFNQGDMYRDFTYIDDIVSGVTAALTKPNLQKYEIFNLGNNRSEKLLDMIGIIEQCLNKKARLELLPMQPGDVKATFADIDRARELLEFEPRTPISKGVPAFIDWFRTHFGC